MRKSQLIALILVAIMAVAVIPAAAVATKLPINSAPAAPSIVGATRTPTLTVGHTPQYPLRGQTFTTWGKLTWTYGTATYNLPNKPVWIYYKDTWDTNWHFYFIAHTSSTGYFQFSIGYYNRALQWLIKFPGDTTYFPASKQDTVYIGGTTTSIWSSSLKPGTAGYTLFGSVKDASGKGLANVPVRLWWRYWNPTTKGYSAWSAAAGYGPITTDATGYWKTPAASIAHNWIQFVAQFEGYPIVSNSPYWESSSAGLWLDTT